MMRPSTLRRSSRFTLAVLLSVVACEDARVAPPDVSFDINESRFDGGNSEFFFASPLAATPGAGDVGYDAGAVNELLVPYVRVCVTDGAEGPEGCSTDVTSEVTGSATGLAMSLNGDLYQVKWQTKSLLQTRDLDYRIEIWGVAFSEADREEQDPRWLFGWRDIRNAPSAANCTGAEEFCLVKYGQTLPIKVRIERFVFCPVARDCAVQFVRAGNDAILEARHGGTGTTSQVFVPGQAGTNFPLAFEPCSPAEDAAVAAATDLPLFGRCWKTTSPFTGTLTEAPIMSFCEEFDVSEFDLADPAQVAQITLHHFSQTGSVAGEITSVEALPHAHACSSPTSGGMALNAPGSSVMSRLARAVTTRLSSWLVPEPLRATTLVIDRGGGGQLSTTNPFGSLFKLALPAKFEYEFPGDGFRTARKGEEVPLRAKVTDLLGGPVKNARVRWSLISAPPADPPAAVLSAVPVTNSEGISEATVRLSATGGNNVFHATGYGIADPRGSECGTTGSSSCNGPRTAGFTNGPFDPFFPFNDFFDPEPGLVPSPIELARGTLLPFTVCTPGGGSGC